MPAETMTSRERVHKTIEGEKTDRIPIDLGVHFSTGISVFAYHNLREHLGLSVDRIAMPDMYQMLARVDEDIIERFHVDTLLLNPPWPGNRTWNIRDDYTFRVPPQIAPQRHPDGSWTLENGGRRAVLLPGGFFMEGDWWDLYDLSAEEKLDLFAERAAYIHQETDKFTMFMGFPAFFWGLDFACDMITDPEGCMAYNEQKLEEQLRYFDRVNAKMGRYIDSIEVNADLGTQNNLMCRPQDFEEICAPYLKRFCRHVKDTSAVKIFMHSCGSIAKVMESIIDCGVDAINPVQISADNMDPRCLTETFGGRITFWGGGCDTQRILNMGTAEEVRRHVQETVRIFKSSGRFVFNQVHNIMGDVPPENIVAMLDTAYESSFF